MYSVGTKFILIMGKELDIPFGTNIMNLKSLLRQPY